MARVGNNGNTGNANSGRHRAKVCRKGLHDLTDPANVGIIHRGKDTPGAEIKEERYCRPCQNERQMNYYWRDHPKR